MKEKYGVFWPTQQELTTLLQEGKIKGPIESDTLYELHPVRGPGKTIEYQELGSRTQEKYMEIAAKRALLDNHNFVFYNNKQQVSTTPRLIIIGMNFKFYQSNKIEVCRNEE
ncbi:MAG: hypothetical protein AABX31_00985 [Nanoarchaeota archaeon]